LYQLHRFAGLFCSGVDEQKSTSDEIVCKGPHILAGRIIEGERFDKFTGAMFAHFRENPQAHQLDVCLMMLDLFQALLIAANDLNFKSKLVHHDLAPRNMHVQTFPDKDDIEVNFLDFGGVRKVGESMYGTFTCNEYWCDKTDVFGKTAMPKTDAHCISEIMNEVFETYLSIVKSRKLLDMDMVLLPYIIDGVKYGYEGRLGSIDAIKSIKSSLSSRGLQLRKPAEDKACSILLELSMGGGEASRVGSRGSLPAEEEGLKQMVESEAPFSLKTPSFVNNLQRVTLSDKPSFFSEKNSTPLRAVDLSAVFSDTPACRDDEYRVSLGL